MAKFRTTRVTDEERTLAARRFTARYGWTPTYAQLTKFMREERIVVGTKFAGTARVYYYELGKGPQPRVGDYVRVWSPITSRWELVRVYSVGVSPSKERAPGELKQAFRITDIEFENDYGDDEEDED